MHWQDLVFAVGGGVFVVGLVPSLHAPAKPALLTSLTIGSGLAAFVVCYLTLHLWLAALTTALQVVAWYILALQVVRRDRA